MASRLLRSAAAASVPLVLWGAPAQAADPIPEGPVELHLKDHPELPLDAEGGEIRLSAVHDLWTVRTPEALVPLGGHQIVHDESGQCLTADTSGGGETAPVLLADCADALTWDVVYDDLPSHQDFRFITADGYYLGLESNDAVEGARVLAVDVDSGTLHSQEWQFAAADVPPPAPPSESPSAPASSAPPTETAARTLPQAGTGAGVAAGAGAAALLGGAALVVWWQRRRALRSHW
ncbi:LPXTG cell wall anchor domain-containing protein [Glycomyces sp. A-F 0318]|uniref:RICIN domain-containing protein n=1 Tax=Glycomyces amatae TaxID=2881355 RepID=UPI001E4CC0B4|nr:LPXTG cell wall anchor domain-containing protein [Glycomyces amatae]MCD0445209.1 LPXTG cell wall anchor domain-containing protein [Glycomyces amatae]